MKDSSNQMKPTGMGNTFNINEYLLNILEPSSFGNTFIPKDK